MGRRFWGSLGPVLRSPSPPRTPLNGRPSQGFEGIRISYIKACIHEGLHMFFEGQGSNPRIESLQLLEGAFVFIKEFLAAA